MRLSVLTIILTICAFVPSSVMAAEKTKPDAIKQIVIYSAPNKTAKVEKKVDPTERLIPIYQKKNWIKVGDPKNGETGWINRDQYNAAMSAYYQPEVQTVFIRTTQNSKEKPKVDVIAYKNGKKLSEKEAKSLYRRINEQQKREARYFQQMFWDMDNFFQWL